MRLTNEPRKNPTELSFSLAKKFAVAFASSILLSTFTVPKSIAAVQNTSWSKLQGFKKDLLDNNGIRIKSIKASYDSKKGVAMTDIIFWDTPDPLLFGVYVYWSRHRNCNLGNLPLVENGHDALMGNAVPWNSVSGDAVDPTGYQAVFDPIWGTDTTSSFNVRPVSNNEVVYIFTGSQLKNRGFTCVDVLPNNPPYIDPNTGIIEDGGNAGIDQSERFVNR